MLTRQSKIYLTDVNTECYDLRDPLDVVSLAVVLMKLYTDGNQKLQAAFEKKKQDFVQRALDDGVVLKRWTKHTQDEELKGCDIPEVAAKAKTIKARRS